MNNIMNYPSWFSTLQNISENLNRVLHEQSEHNSQTSPFSLAQAMQMSPIPLNTNYKDIAQDFIMNYSISNNFGFICVANYYNSDAMCSIHIHKGINEHILHETNGHSNFKNKLAELGITTLKYSNITFTPQPLGKNSILINYFGNVEINTKIYVFDSTIVLKLDLSPPRITNHVLQIFMQ